MITSAAQLLRKDFMAYMSVPGLSSCLFLEQTKPHSSDDSLLEDLFSRPALVFMMFPLLYFLTTTVVPGKLPGLGQILCLSEHASKRYKI